MDAAFYPLLWVMVTPFAFAALVGGSRRANALAARHLPLVVSVGWVGVVLLVAGVVALHSDVGRAMLLVGAPLAGLSFWTRAPGDDRGDDPEPDPEPPPDEWDWERFLSDLEQWRLSREARRPRSPARSR